MNDDWLAFLKTGLGLFAGLFFVCLALIVTQNPYGNLPKLLPMPHVITDTAQRHQYPGIVRTGDYDSAVFGTSSSRLLAPAELQAAFGGNFANLAMNDARAWEQVQLAKLFLDETPKPRTIVFALDWVWCRADAATEKISKRGWPPWIYDDDPWNDWLYILNVTALDRAVRQVATRLGFIEPRLPADGYKVFVPPEEEFDLERARGHIWGSRERVPPPMKPLYRPRPRDLERWSYPALSWLDELLAETPRETRKIVTFMPAHVAGQPAPGSREEGRIGVCKRKVAEIASRHEAHFVDFWIRSPITMDDANYWDPAHYRVDIASRIVKGLADAVSDPQAESEDWRRTPPAVPVAVTSSPR